MRRLMTTRRRPRHRESDLQIACVLWFRVKYPKLDKLLFAVPNGGQRSAATARILKAEGVVAGVADLILLVPRGGFASLCIEMKAGTAGRQSQSQRAWQEAAEGAGNRYVIVRSLEEFEAAVTEYLWGVSEASGEGVKAPALQGKATKGVRSIRPKHTEQPQDKQQHSPPEGD